MRTLYRIGFTLGLSALLAALLLATLTASAAPASSPAGPSPGRVSTAALGAAATPETDLVWASLVALPGTDVERFFVEPVYRQALGDVERIAGLVPAETLPELDRCPGVLYLLDGSTKPTPPSPAPDDFPAGSAASNLRGRERVAAIRAHATTSPPPKSQVVSPQSPESWYENDTQGVRETWSTLGLTGTGVTVAVLDSGIDFGNPALAGRYAVQPATLTGTQAYAGWPIAYDDRSLADFLSEPARAWPGNWGWYVNAGYPVTGSGVFTFANPISATQVLSVPGTSRSGRYLLGYHPDALLDGAPLLVADEATAGIYDTVYADLDYDGAFETRMDRTQPVGTLDLSGDGVPDVSAGMLYWIADGINPPPGSAGVYGPGLPAPAAGTLLAMMIDSTWESGGGHGTSCAGTAVGNDAGVFVPEPRVASFYTTTYGPLVQGPAPGARLAALGNVYEGGSMDAWYLFTVLGYDGVPGSGDEPEIVSLSFGEGKIDPDGWDWESRYLAYLNLYYDATYGPGTSPLFVHSVGNSGPGYGSTISPNPATGLIVGASTQLGTLNNLGISETVSLPGRTNTQDVFSFSSRGPGADGRGAPDLLANGMAGTGAYPLNYFIDGTRAYVHWSGTSRSAPVAGGMAALAAQAFRQAHGRFPTYDELRTLLINGAHDRGHDPFGQGAGQADVFRSTQLALSRYGVQVSPAGALAGDFRGQRYPLFAQTLARGEAEALTFTITNPSPVAIDVALETQHLVQVARYTATLQTITDTSTNYGRGAPDYALDLTPWLTAHPEADLLVVRMTLPFEHFDQLPPAPPARNRWRLMVYNWWDDNANGTWWTDTTANGRVDWPDEIDGSDEWLRFDYNYYYGSTQHEVRVGRPYARSLGAGGAGLWAGAAHMVRSSGDNRTQLHFEVLFYQNQPWQAVALSTAGLTLPPGPSQATFQAVVHVPPDAPHGLYEGAIVVRDAGRTDLNPTYRPHTLTLPLVWSVHPQIGPAAGALLGGSPPATSPYDNGRVYGAFDWTGRTGNGDWRFYPLDLQDPPPGSVLLMRNTWQDYPTDIDTLIFGPAADGFSQQHPAWFGPYSQAQVGGSVRTGSSPQWRFQTASGGTEEWVAAPAQDGLHTLAHHAVLFGGHQGSVPFTTALGLVYVQPYPLRIDPATCAGSCAFTMTLRATLDVPGGLTNTHAFGWLEPALFLGQPITAGETITHALVFTQSLYRLTVALENGPSIDALSLALYDDTGAVAGAWDTADRELARVAGSGTGATLTKQALLDGQHWLRLEGAAVQPGGGTYDLQIIAVPWSAAETLSVSGLPADLIANQTYTLTLTASHVPSTGLQGLLVFGPPDLPYAFEVPVLVDPLAGLWVRKSGPSEIQPGQVATYTITYGNGGPSTAHDVRLTDTLPAGFSPLGPLALGPLTLTAGSAHTWTLAARVGTGVPVNSWYTNSVQIDGQEFDPQPADNHAGAGLLVAGADVWVRKSGPVAVERGQAITYTITYGNHGTLTAHDVRLTDTPPLSISLASPLVRGPLTLAPGEVHTWTLTATVHVEAPTRTAMTNSVSIRAQEFDPLPGNNTGRIVAIIDPLHTFLPIVMRGWP